MAYFNNRVIVQTYNEGTGYAETVKAIHEVFYDDEGNVEMWTENPTSLMVYEGETFTDMMKRLEVAIGKQWLTVAKDKHGKEILVAYTGEK